MTCALLERLGVELPVVQAGMGGGIATPELAAAVSEAGGLGTLGIAGPATMRAELAEARERTTGPLAVNLLLPFARPAHWAAAAKADVVVTFWGRPKRRTARPWLHQCGSVEEARSAHAEGADGVIVQGVEAGGHVRATLPALELLEQARRVLPGDYPILLAGGLAERADVAEALAAGAGAAVLGTRFVMSEQSGAHDAYRRRLIGADDTVLTELFGFGWPAPHRVLRNAAVRRWIDDGDGGHSAGAALGPAWLRAVNRASAPARLIPIDMQLRLARLQRASLPFLSPLAPAGKAPTTLRDAGPLYAGESVARMSDIRPAEELVTELAAPSRS